jgi:hypothetical protein
MMQSGVLERVRVQAVPKVLFEPIEVKGYVRRAPKRRVVRVPQRDPVVALQGVAELFDALKGGPMARAKADAKVEGKTKRTAFVLFWLMATLLVGAMWAGAHG